MGVLLLVIVFVLVLVRRSPARARSPAHTAQHGDDAHTERFRRCCGLWIDQSLESKEVNDCGAFHGRTSRNGVEASALPLSAMLRGTEIVAHVYDVHLLWCRRDDLIGIVVSSANAYLTILCLDTRLLDCFRRDNPVAVGEAKSIA